MKFDRNELDKTFKDCTKDDFCISLEDGTVCAFEDEEEESNLCSLVFGGWRCGASKIVNVDLFPNHVIKFHPSHIYYNVEEPELITNFCDKEFEMFKQAIKHGVSQAFAAITKIKSSNDEIGYYYIQQKADTDSEVYPSRESIKYVRSSQWKNSIIGDINFTASLYDYYGENFVKRLIHFVRILGINDLECRNVGYIGDKPVLFDYSGYFDFF